MSEKLKCVWNLNSPCGGKVEKRKVFPEIDVTVLKNHFEEHLIIIELYKLGCDVEELFQLTLEQKKEKLNQLKNK